MIPSDYLLVEVLSPPATGAFIIGRSLIGSTLTDPGVTLVWKEYLGAVNSMSTNRGGAQRGAATSLNVGMLSIRIINAADPFTDVAIKPNSAIRVTAAHPLAIPAIVAGASANIFTGTIQDVFMNYDNKGNTFVTIIAADGVQSVNNTVLFGATSSSGLGYETWSQRINQLCTSSTTPVNPPASSGAYSFIIGKNLIGDRLTSEGTRLQDLVYASTLSNHFDVACNSVGAYWWVDRDNVIQFLPQLAQDSIVARFYDVLQPADPMNIYFTGIEASYDTKNVVNNLTITNYGMKFDPSTGYNVANSITYIDSDITGQATWGSRGTTVDTSIYNGPGHTTAIQDCATQILTGYGTPEVSIQSVTFDALKNINFAWTIDLYSRVWVTFKGVAHRCRVTSITHDIQPMSWTTKLTLRKE